MKTPTVYDGTIAGQVWRGTAPNEWKRGVVTIRLVECPLGQDGAGYLATGPGISAWAKSADDAVQKLALRAQNVLRDLGAR